MTARRRRAPGAVVLLAVSAVLVSACSDDPFADYCEVVSDRQTALTRTLDEGGPDALLKALPVFRELRDAAPDDIRDDWKLVVDDLTALDQALKDADVDAATYDRDDPPDGLDQEEKDRIDAAAQALTAPDTVAAFAAVEQQARDVCQAPLRL